MNIRDVEYFAVIAEQRHMGRAAQELGLSAPALSKSLQRLEKSAKTRLVLRTPKGIELTPAGMTLLSHVGRLRLSLQDVAREIADLGEGRAGLLRMGVHPVLVDDLLAPACEALLQAAPNVQLSVTVEITDVTIAAVRAGELDFAFTTLPQNAPDDLEHEHLLDDHVVVFAAKNHRLAGRKKVSLAEVADEKWVITALNTQPGWAWLHSVFDAARLQPSQIAVRTNSLDLRNRLVASGGFLGFMSRMSLQRHANSLGLVEIPVDGMKWRRRIGITHRRNAYLTPAARRMIELLKEACGRPR